MHTTTIAHEADVDASTLDELRAFVDATRDLPGDSIVRARTRVRGGNGDGSPLRRLHARVAR